MPQGLSAHRPTAYPARPEASTKATGHVPQHPQARAQENARPSAATELIDHLRSTGRTLTYDRGCRTLRADTEDAIAVTIGHSR